MPSSRAPSDVDSGPGTDEELPLELQGRIGEAARSLCRRAAEARATEAAEARAAESLMDGDRHRCAARWGALHCSTKCELVAYDGAIYCESEYCGCAPTDDRIVRLNNYDFRDLYGRRRRANETSNFLQRAAQRKRGVPPDVVDPERLEGRTAATQGAPSCSSTPL